MAYNDVPVPPYQQDPRQTTQQQPQSNWAYANPSPSPAQKGKKRGGAKTFLLAFCGAALACALFGGIAFGTGALKSGSTTTLGGSGAAITATAADDDATLSEQVASKVLPSIVAIDVYTNQSTASTYGYHNWGSNNGSSSTLTQTSLGSGVIISSDGYILTNYHVVSGADQLKVTVNDGAEYTATVVGVDESSDLAVIKVDAKDLTAVEIGSSSDLKAGEWVMTAGSPFGLEQSVATGIVSATSRTITVSNDSSDGYGYNSNSSGSVSVYPGMIQTDAAINPGNSGGALVNSRGQLIGINSVIESYSGSYSGVGFAIPVDYAVNIAQQIIDGKTPSHASLGVSVTSVTSTIAQRYNLSINEGAYVNGVFDGTAASAAGLKEGDIITKVDSTQISSSTDLIAAVRIAGVGSQVTITYYRDGQQQTCQATLGSDTDVSSSSPLQRQSSATPFQQSPGGSGSGEGNQSAA